MAVPFRFTFTGSEAFIYDLFYAYVVIQIRWHPTYYWIPDGFEYLLHLIDLLMQLVGVFDVMQVAIPYVSRRSVERLPAFSEFSSQLPPSIYQEWLLGPFAKDIRTQSIPLLYPTVDLSACFCSHFYSPLVYSSNHFSRSTISDIIPTIYRFAIKFLLFFAPSPKILWGPRRAYSRI